MYCVRNITEDLYWVGANDHRLHLFENIHPIPHGVSYNAYLLLDHAVDHGSAGAEHGVAELAVGNGKTEFIEFVLEKNLTHHVAEHLLLERGIVDLAARSLGLLGGLLYVALELLNVY